MYIALMFKIIENPTAQFKNQNLNVIHYIQRRFGIIFM